MPRKIPSRRYPVNDGVRLRYNGPAMFQDAYRGPVTGIGYYAEPGQTVEVDPLDADAMLATMHWEKPKRRRERKRRTTNESVESEVGKDKEEVSND